MQLRLEGRPPGLLAASCNADLVEREATNILSHPLSKAPTS